MRTRTTMAAAAVGLLLVAGCSGGTDPYYEALEAAGWSDGPLGQDEQEELFEEMAIQVCAEVKERLDAGDDDTAVMAAALPLIDGSDPMSEHALGALDAMLEHRCDAGQPDGMKAD